MEIPESREGKMQHEKIPVRMLAIAVVALAGCATFKGSYVAEATVRGPFIDATLSTPNGEWRFLFPRTETCAEMLRPEAPITYSTGGSFGRVRNSDGVVCDPVGAGTLHRWRRSRQMSEMAPRSPASWTILHEDPQVFLLRGRFPVASRVGLANTFDVVAMVPNDDVCGPIARSGTATLVFRTAGRRVLDLGQCPVLGVSAPPQSR
jgi:hypothetical protein